MKKILERIKIFFQNFFKKAEKEAAGKIKKIGNDVKKEIFKPQFMKWVWLFFAGFFVYMGTEVIFTGFISNFTSGPLFRFMGHSSLWMGIIGGVMLISLGALNGIKWIKKQNLFIQSLIGAVVITATEFICGCIFNLWWGLNIWDYSGIWFNLFGQINLFYSVFWFFLSPFAFWADDTLRWVLYKTGICTSAEAPYNLCWFYKQLFSFKPILYPITTAKKK